MQLECLHLEVQGTNLEWLYDLFFEVSFDYLIQNPEYIRVLCY